MNPYLGWTLAALALAAGYLSYGWPGVLLAITVIVFWLLLQFSRALRVMRQAGQAPVGSVASAGMLHARLRSGQRLMDVIRLTGSLGERASDAGVEPEVWRWRDSGGDAVALSFERGRLVRWTLERAPHEAPPAAA